MKAENRIKMYVVGGAVRDVLLGRTPKDIDYVVVGATPEDMLNNGLKSIPATSFPVFHDKDGNEVALARKERKVGTGYHGFVCDFDASVTLEEDLFRRDLTINSMAVYIQDWAKFKKTHKTTLLVDPYNGMGDLIDGVVRHTSKFFTEDPVRALRAIRLANRYGFSISPSTEDLIRNMVKSGELDHLTPERIWLEVEKVFKDSKHISGFFVDCDNYGVYAKIFPNTKELYVDEENLDAYNAADCDDMEYAYLAMMNCNTLEYLEQFSIDMKLPLTYYKIAKGYQLLRFLIDDQQMDQPVKIIRLFQMLNAFQSPERFLKICDFIVNVEHECVDECNMLRSMLVIVSEIGYDNLSSAEREELKGKDVGEAITNLQIETLQKLV